MVSLKKPLLVLLTLFLFPRIPDFSISSKLRLPSLLTFSLRSSVSVLHLSPLPPDA